MSAIVQLYRLWVAELSDQASPRIEPDKPNLHVDFTVEDPGQRFNQLRRGVRPEHPVATYGVRLRPELYDHVPASSDRAGATAARKKLIQDLRRQGYVVNGVGNRYRVYVILLRDEVGPRKRSDKPRIYVGRTSKDVKERFREHIDGARNSRGPLYSRVVHKYGVELMPELYESISHVYTLEEAQRLEKEVAQDLSRQGYSVRGGH